VDSFLTHPPDIDLSEKQIDLLLHIAREAITKGLEGEKQWRPGPEPLPERLLRPGACFVTLFTKGELHGCIGSVEPHQPLAHDVAKNAISAAFKDPRFSVLKTSELAYTAIEVSILSPVREISFHSFDHLIEQIQPGEDGVLVERGRNRGLLLPQVWDKITDPYEFLTQVALKAQASISIYNDPETRVSVFRVHHYLQPAPQG
jgi:uncharacterized protein